MDRQVRRPRRRRLRRVRATLDPRAAQPGLEGLRRLHPRPERRARDRSRRARRGPGLRLRREAAARRPGRGPRRGRPRHAAPVRGRGPPAPLRGRLLGRGRALLRDGPRRQEAADGRDRLERRPVPLVRDRLAGPRPRRGRPADEPGDVLGLGDPDVCRGSAGLQPDRLSHGVGLAARHLADRRRPEAVRLRRGVQPARRARVPGRPALPGLPPAGAVLRVRPRPLGAARAVPGGLLAAGLGRRRIVPVRRDDARAPGRRPASTSWSCITRSCPTGSER